jgi:hypothetical protein
MDLSKTKQFQHTPVRSLNPPDTLKEHGWQTICFSGSIGHPCTSNACNNRFTLISAGKYRSKLHRVRFCITETGA